MSEPNKVNPGHQKDIDSIVKEPPPMDWRSTCLGLGIFMMVGALFAAASGTGTARLLAKLFLIVAVVLIAVPVAANVVNAVSSRMKRANGTTSKPRS